MKCAIQYAKQLRHIIKPPAVEWSGDYASWAAASEASSGYSMSNIAEKAFLAARDVIHGRAAYCRDGMTFKNPEFNWPLITFIQALHRSVNRPIRVVDFGGAYGDSYLQNRYFICDLVDNWQVVEQPSLAERAKELPFVEKVEFSCLNTEKIGEVDLVIFSSVLQYLDEYRDVVHQMLKAAPFGIFIDRTGFVEGSRTVERITKQTVRPPLYSASYPCRFFVRSNFIKLFEPYRLRAEWSTQDFATIPSQYLGMYFEKSRNE